MASSSSGASNSPSAVYTKTPYNLVINSFHSLPHLNMWFAMSNSTFDPNNSDYLETILFWSTVPILFLIFILLILIIYACGLVVLTNNTSTVKLNPNTNRFYGTNGSTSSKKSKKLFKYKFFISIFVFFLSVSLGFIVYGSEHFHHSFSNVTWNIRNFSNYFASIGSQARLAKNSIHFQLNTTLAKYEKDLRKSVNNQSNNKLANEALKELNNIKMTLNDSYNSLDVLNQLESEKNTYLNLLNQINLAEQTRWAIMIGVVTINMLLITLLIIGLIRNSKGSLCFFAFAGVLSLISIWVLNSLYLGITVFISDYCTSPDQYILTVAEKNQMKYLVQYYTTCSVSPIGNTKLNHNIKYQPFKLDLNRAESKLRTASTMYNDNLIRMSKSLLNEQLLQSYNFIESIQSVENLLDNIRSMIKCEQTSLNYRQAVNTLCTNSILGLAIIVLAGIMFGIIIPILICIIPQLWRRMHKKDLFDYHSSNLNSHNLNEETHPFISLNGGTGHIRTNISAARQFNESPSFQRLAAASSSINSNTTNSLSRNRYNTTSRANYASNNTGLLTNSNQNYSQTLKMNNRLNEYMINTDPYLMQNNNNNGFPSAPNHNQIGSNSNVYQSYYTQTQTTAQGLYH